MEVISAFVRWRCAQLFQLRLSRMVEFLPVHVVIAGNQPYRSRITLCGIRDVVDPVTGAAIFGFRAGISDVPGNEYRRCRAGHDSGILDGRAVSYQLLLDILVDGFAAGLPKVDVG